MSKHQQYLHGFATYHVANIDDLVVAFAGNFAFVN